MALAGVNNGLIFSDIIGQVLNVGMAVSLSIRNGFRYSLISAEKLKYVLKKYSEFPKFNLIPALMSACSYYLPTLFINKFFSTESTGYFDLTKLLLSIPLALIATSFSNVLLQSISEKFLKKQSLLNDLKPVFYIVASIIIVEIVVISLFGTELFILIFGKEWGISGEISKILVWSFALNFLVSSFSCIYISMRKIKIYSIWQFSYFVLIVLLIFFRNQTFTGFLKIYVFLEIVAYILILINMFNLIYKYEVSIRKNI
jgi:O-antigen/teichoic acid export membrane protein